MRQLVLYLTAACLIAACGGSTDGGTTAPPPPPPTDTFSLRALAEARGRRIGAAADHGFHLNNADGDKFRAVLAREFDLLTPENDMKFDHLHPARQTFDYVHAD